MTRAVVSVAIDSDWKLVSTEHPCPICGALDGCSVHTIDQFASCARQPSSWKLVNGAWLHRVANNTQELDASAQRGSGTRLRGARV